jgi:hypothetical protein
MNSAMHEMPVTTQRAFESIARDFCSAFATSDDRASTPSQKNAASSKQMWRRYRKSRLRQFAHRYE